MSFFSALWASPPATPLSKYTVANGVFYMVMGFSIFAYPAQLQLVFQADPFEAGEEGLVRVVGMTTALIGWFYVMGGRTRADSFSLSTVVDRLLVPLFLLPLGFSGALDMHIAVPFSILDPVLGLGALVIWMKTKQ